MMGLLIVDDEEGVRRSLKKVLERDGYAIFLAGDGVEAIDIVRENIHQIETVICDYKMPGIDGLETLVEIGKLNPEIARIMLTGYATMESAIESVNEGIDGFLTKPFSNVELRAKVKDYNLKKRLKPFVSEQVYVEMQKGAGNMCPRRQKVTILFSDIRGFTEKSERLSTEELSRMLNVSYFTPLDRIICEFNGTLDKHIGDSIMGVFGAPIGNSDDTARAVRCAIGMMEEIERVNRELSGNDGGLAIGIGISTGEVMAGIFGSSRKKEYTVFGPPVNVAARLERLARKSQILMCDTTYQEVKEIVRVEKLDPVGLKGIQRKIDIFRIIGSKN
jgi:adenylate cyclase